MDKTSNILLREAAKNRGYLFLGGLGFNISFFRRGTYQIHSFYGGGGVSNFLLSSGGSRQISEILESHFFLKFLVEFRNIG